MFGKFCKVILKTSQNYGRIPLSFLAGAEQLICRTPPLADSAF